VPSEGIPLYEVKSSKMYKLIVFGSLAQLAASAIITPLLFVHNPKVKIDQWKKATLAIVVLSWGVGIAYLTRQLSSRIILQMRLVSETKGVTELQLYTMNFFGGLVSKNVSLECLKGLDSAAQTKLAFVKIRAGNKDYFMDRSGIILDQTIFQKLVSGALPN